MIESRRSTMLRKMNKLGQRIAHIRRLANLNQEEFARRLRDEMFARTNERPKGPTRGAVGNWELEGGAKRENLSLISTAFGVDMNWLASGIGTTPTRLDNFATSSEPVALSGQDAPHTVPHMAESSVDYDIGLARTMQVREMDVRAGAGGGGVPVEAFVSDGNGNTFAAEGIRGEWTVPDYVMRDMMHAAPQHIRVFEVIGNSMEPRLSEGDRVFIDLRYTAPTPEGIFALWDGYGVVIKQLQIVRGTDPLRVRIISINATYSVNEAIIDEVKIIGRMIGRFTLN
jgi:phage repressor protein C with HTH and peptisase S24 domain